MVLAAAGLIGSVHAQVRASLGLAAAGFAALALFCDALGRRSLKLGWAFHLPIFLALVVLLQLLPLPVSLRSLIDPASVKSLGPALSALDLSSTRPLAWDVPNALMGLVHYASLASVVLVSIVVCRRRSRALRFAWALNIGLLTLSALSLVNYISGDDRLWWVYNPVADVGNAVAPFVNENHAGGFYLAASLFHLGLSLTIPPSRKRWATLSLGLLPVFLCFLARSRGAHVGFFAGLLVLIMAMYKNDHFNRDFAFKILAAAVVVVIGLIPSVQVVRDAYGAKGLEGVSEDEKVKLWVEGLELVKEHPVTGVGSGAYRLAMATKAPPKRRGSVSHAENLLLQLGAELGLPAFLFFLGIGLFSLIRFVPKTRWGPGACGAVGALAGLFLQNLVDFNLEFPGTAFLAAALVGFVATSRRKRSPSSARRKQSDKPETEKETEPETEEGTEEETEQEKQNKRAKKEARKAKKRLKRRLRYAYTASFLILSTGSSLVSLFWAAPHTLLNDTKRVEKSIKKGDLEVAHKQVKGALKRHPADYYLHYLKALSLYGLGKGEPLKWLNLSIALGGSDPRPHLLASQVLAAVGGLDQSASELAVALARGATATSPVLDFFSGLTRLRLEKKEPHQEASFQSMRLATVISTQGAAFAFPLLRLAQVGWREGSRRFLGSLVTRGLPTADRNLHLTVARGLLERRLVEPAIALYEVTARRWPEEVKGLLTVPKLLLSAGRPEAALHWALRIVDTTKNPEAYLLAARIHKRAFAHKRAYVLLSSGLSLYPRHQGLTQATASAALRVGFFKKARSLADSALTKFTDMGPKARVRFLSILRAVAAKEKKTGEVRRLDYRIARIRVLQRALRKKNKNED